MSAFEMAVHVIVEGKVQRVGYRAWTEGQAQARGLSGWARNRAEGTVEAVFAGPASVVEAMLSACHAGPQKAEVSRLDVRAATVAELADVVPGLFQVRDTL
jgi:acylphosphatase